MSDNASERICCASSQSEGSGVMPSESMHETRDEGRLTDSRESSEEDELDTLAFLLFLLCDTPVELGS